MRWLWIYTDDGDAGMICEWISPELARKVSDGKESGVTPLVQLEKLIIYIWDDGLGFEDTRFVIREDLIIDPDEIETY